MESAEEAVQSPSAGVVPNGIALLDIFPVGEQPTARLQSRPQDREKYERALIALATIALNDDKRRAAARTPEAALQHIAARLETAPPRRRRGFLSGGFGAGRTRDSDLVLIDRVDSSSLSSRRDIRVDAVGGAAGGSGTSTSRQRGNGNNGSDAAAGGSNAATERRKARRPRRNAAQSVADVYQHACLSRLTLRRKPTE